MLTVCFTHACASGAESGVFFFMGAGGEVWRGVGSSSEKGTEEVVKRV
jgi:hypothetical protein